MLTSIFSQTTTSNISVWAILLCSSVSLVLGVVIAYIHKRTSRYSKNFLVTLACLPILVQSVMIMVSGNLGTSVAILGAFGLIRFRSMPGTSKEILSVFFAMAIGLAMGMGHIFFAILITIIVVIAILLFYNTKIFDKKDSERILRITVPEDLDYDEIFDDVFKEFLNKYTLEKVKTINLGSLYELTYQINLKYKQNAKKFIDELRIRNGNLKIVLSHKLDESEF